MHYAYDALQLEQQGSHGHGRSCALKAMSRTLAEFDKEATRASCPARSTITAPQEIHGAAADAASKLTQWMSLLDGQLEGVAEISSLTALQRVSERMESEAGLFISGEILAVLDDRSLCRLDDLGRERLRSLCTEFHRLCVKSLAQGTEWCPSKFVH